MPLPPESASSVGLGCSAQPAPDGAFASQHPQARRKSLTLRQRAIRAARNPGALAKIAHFFCLKVSPPEARLLIFPQAEDLAFRPAIAQALPDQDFGI
ncbi:MAG: hypothetical protein ACC619_09640, partial [Paracoccaceae bacterium]